ncbi:hypothetical protein D3C81_760140 [compost metagenome]
MHLAKRRQRGLDDALGTGQGGDVVAAGNRLAATGADLPGHVLRRVGANIIDHHAGTLGGERQGIGTAQSTTGTGDDHRAAFTYSHV